MGEKVFFSQAGVKVTSTRFIVSSQTFAMSCITSIELSEEKPSRIIPSVIVAIGVMALFCGKAILPYAVAAIVIGGAWLVLQRSLFHVLLTSASGETKALSSNNGKWIEKVVTALNDSIVYRG